MDWDLLSETDWKEEPYERAKVDQRPKHEEPDKVLKILRYKKFQIRQKLSQCYEEGKRKELKKERTRENNAVQKRKAFMEEKLLLSEANDIMNSKDNATASLALKKLFLRKPASEKKIKTKILTEHFKTQFCRNQQIPKSHKSPNLVTLGEVKKG